MSKLRNYLKGDTSNASAPQADQNWSIVAVDADIETQIRWHRTNYILGASMVEIQWAIPNYAEPGLYRIRHEGFYKVNYMSQILSNVGIYFLIFGTSNLTFVSQNPKDFTELLGYFCFSPKISDPLKTTLREYLYLKVSSP